MYSVECNNQNSIQMYLTPLKAETRFRVNAQETKRSVEQTIGAYERCDVVEISPEGYQMLADSTFGTLNPDRALSRRREHTYQVPLAPRYSPPE